MGINRSFCVLLSFFRDFFYNTFFYKRRNHLLNLLYLTVSPDIFTGCHIYLHLTLSMAAASGGRNWHKEQTESREHKNNSSVLLYFTPFCILFVYQPCH